MIINYVSVFSSILFLIFGFIQLEIEISSEIKFINSFRWFFYMILGYVFFMCASYLENTIVLKVTFFFMFFGSFLVLSEYKISNLKFRKKVTIKGRKLKRGFFELLMDSFTFS